MRLSRIFLVRFHVLVSNHCRCVCVCGRALSSWMCRHTKQGVQLPGGSAVACELLCEPTMFQIGLWGEGVEIGNLLHGGELFHDIVQLLRWLLLPGRQLCFLHSSVDDLPNLFLTLKTEVRAHAKGVVLSESRVSAFYDHLKPPF